MQIRTDRGGGRTDRNLPKHWREAQNRYLHGNKALPLVNLAAGEKQRGESEKTEKKKTEIRHTVNVLINLHHLPSLPLGGAGVSS